MYSQDAVYTLSIYKFCRLNSPNHNSSADRPGFHTDFCLAGFLNSLVLFQFLFPYREYFFCRTFPCLSTNVESLTYMPELSCLYQLFTIASCIWSPRFVEANAEFALEKATSVCYKTYQAINS
jgi:hypothetical protein